MSHALGGLLPTRHVRVYSGPDAQAERDGAGNHDLEGSAAEGLGTPAGCVRSAGWGEGCTGCGEGCTDLGEGCAGCEEGKKGVEEEVTVGHGECWRVVAVVV